MTWSCEIMNTKHKIEIMSKLDVAKSNEGIFISVPYLQKHALNYCLSTFEIKIPSEA